MSVTDCPAVTECKKHPEIISRIAETIDMNRDDVYLLCPLNIQFYEYFKIMML